MKIIFFQNKAIMLHIYDIFLLPINAEFQYLTQQI